jgi:glucuronate isomerase
METFKEWYERILEEGVNGGGIRIGYAVYSDRGYEIKNDDGGNVELRKLLDMGYPKVSRGMGFSPIYKIVDNGIILTMQGSGSGAGGMMKFVTVVILNSNKPEMMKRGLEKIIERGNSGEFIYVLNKMIEFISKEIGKAG